MGKFQAICLAVAVVLAASLVAETESAKILAVFPIPARSHMISLTSLTKALAKKGHDITLFSALPQKDMPANHKNIVLGDPFEAMMRNQKLILEEIMNPITQMSFLWNWGEAIGNATINNPLFKEHMNKPGTKYDLVMVEAFFFQELFVALGHKYNCPVVAFNPFGTFAEINDIVGNPVNPSWVPSPFLGFPSRMTFLERAFNAVYYLYLRLGTQLYHMPKQQALADEFFPGYPPLSTLLNTRLALTLVNNHFTLSQPEPVAPNLVEVGGMHINENIKPLPKDLQDFMDGAKEGVVYFSMGSNLRMEHLPQEWIDAVFGALTDLKQRVLMRWDGPGPANKGANIMVRDWLPQSDLLGHPNLRLFVTHGGLLSTQESIFRGVPLIGIPVFGDQAFNMKSAVNKGFCVAIPFKELNREKLDSALKEVLGNPKYKESAKRLSALFRSKPIRPIDLAVFWVEHVLANGGEHLRPSSTDLYWFQLLLLDVLLVVSAPVILLLLCCRAICCRRKPAAAPATKSKKKTN